MRGNSSGLARSAVVIEPHKICHFLDVAGRENQFIKNTRRLAVFVHRAPEAASLSAYRAKM